MFVISSLVVLLPMVVVPQGDDVEVRVLSRKVALVKGLPFGTGLGRNRRVEHKLYSISQER